MVTEAQRETTQATTVRARAETEKVAAERAAAEDRATAARLRSELDETRRQYHDELDALRREARADRDQLRADHAQQLTEERQAAKDRVAALNRALEVAQSTPNGYRAQLSGGDMSTPEPITSDTRDQPSTGTDEKPARSTG